MERYRLANAIAVCQGSVEATTDELRTAMIQYRAMRAMFDELLRDQRPVESRSAA